MKLEQAAKDADFTGMTPQKQTANRMDIRKKILEDKKNVEKEIYVSENIPRTKKIQKMEAKKKLKKLKKNDKILDSLGDMMGKINVKNGKK